VPLTIGQPVLLSALVRALHSADLELLTATVRLADGTGLQVS
jgi:hypothetical protein